MTLSFSDALNNVLNDNRQQNDFNPTDIKKGADFLGRILPLENGSFPFVIYHEAWVSFTKKDGSVVGIPVIVDPNNSNDQLAKLLSTIISYNKAHATEENKGADTIRVASGKYPLAIRTRALFLGVPVITSQNQIPYQAVDNNGHQAVSSYRTSYSAMKAVAEQLRPTTPYLYNGKKMFNDEKQFMTTGNTFPVNMHFMDADRGVGSWTAQVRVDIPLKAMNFDYLAKGQQGNYLYVDDIRAQARPLIESNPKFYQQILQQLTDSYNKQLAQLSSNPYAPTGLNNQAPSNDGMPFSSQGQSQAPTQGQPQQPAPANQAPFNQGQQPQQNLNVDVVKGMTGKPVQDFKGQAPMSSYRAPQAPADDLSAPFPSSADMQEPTAPTQSQASQQPQQNQQDQANINFPDLNASSSVDDFLNNLK